MQKLNREWRAIYDFHAITILDPLSGEAARRSQFNHALEQFLLSQQKQNKRPLKRVAEDWCLSNYQAYLFRGAAPQDFSLQRLRAALMSMETTSQLVANGSGIGHEATFIDIQGLVFDADVSAAEIALLEQVLSTTRLPAYGASTVGLARVVRHQNTQSGEVESAIRAAKLLAEHLVVEAAVRNGLAKVRPLDRLALCVRCWIARHI